MLEEVFKDMQNVIEYNIKNIIKKVEKGKKLDDFEISYLITYLKFIDRVKKRKGEN